MRSGIRHVSFHTGSMAANSVQVVWNDNTPGESNFTLQYEISNSGNWQTAAVLAPNTTSFTHTGLTTGTSYDYRVQACDSSGCSDFSNITTAVAGFMRLSVSISGGGRISVAIRIDAGAV